MKIYVGLRIDNDFWNRFGGKISVLVFRPLGHGMEMIVNASTEILDEISKFHGIAIL